MSLHCAVKFWYWPPIQVYSIVWRFIKLKIYYFLFRSWNARKKSHADCFLLKNQIPILKWRMWICHLSAHVPMVIGVPSIILTLASFQGGFTMTMMWGLIVDTVCKIAVFQTTSAVIWMKEARYDKMITSFQFLVSSFVDLLLGGCFRPPMTEPLQDCFIAQK